MKSLFILCIFSFLSLAFAVSNAVAPPKLYWDTAMHGAPMPAEIKKLVTFEWVEDWGTRKSGQHKLMRDCYYFYYTGCELSNATFFFFLEGDMQLGTSKILQLVKSSNPAKFLPRREADMVPFSSGTVSELFDALHVDPASVEAKKMRDTITRCEAPASNGEEKLCATSLESMIDFSISKLGGNVQALVSEIAEEQTKPQAYKIVGLKKMPTEDAMICHKQTYPYAVFNCHMYYREKSRATVYKASLVGADGKKARVVGICHDTSAWNPKDSLFDALNVKPGTVPICHFLPGDHIVWIPK